MADLPDAPPNVDSLKNSSPTALVNSNSSEGAALRLASKASVDGISSIADLKKKYPKFWKFMLISMAQNICIDLKRHQEKLADLWREMRQENK